MEDGEGREIDFKNTIILLTSNACTDQLMKLCDDPETMPSPSGMVKTIKPELNKIFKPAFLGRMVVIPYYPIRDENLKRIVELKLNKIKRRIFENHKIHLNIDPAVIDEVAQRCTEVESGARNVDNILTNTMLPDISRRLLTAFAEGEKLSSVTVAPGAGWSLSVRVGVRVGASVRPGASKNPVRTPEERHRNERDHSREPIPCRFYTTRAGCIVD